VLILGLSGTGGATNITHTAYDHVQEVGKGKMTKRNRARCLSTQRTVAMNSSGDIGANRDNLMHNYVLEVYTVEMSLLVQGTVEMITEGEDI
jgi:hypothetical protein